MGWSRVAWRPAQRALAPFIVDAFEATQERAFVHRAPTVAPLSQLVLCVLRELASKAITSSPSWWQDLVSSLSCTLVAPPHPMHAGSEDEPAMQAAQDVQEPVPMRRSVVP